jgi:hypothetical protein
MVLTTTEALSLFVIHNRIESCAAASPRVAALASGPYTTAPLIEGSTATTRLGMDMGASCDRLAPD